MKKSLCFLLLLLLYTCKTKAQVNTLQFKGKYFISSGFFLGIYYREKGELLNVDFAVLPKFGYFISSHLMPYVGFGTEYINNKSYTNDSKASILAFSPGIRYYFTKKNLLFLETGFQYGKIYTNNNTVERFHFSQARCGAGLNYLFAQGTDNGKFSLEFMFKYNFDLMENSPGDFKTSGTLSPICTSFGFNYFFPVKSSYTIQKKNLDPETPASIASLQIVKFGTPLRISYCFEKKMDIKTAIDLEFMAEDIANLWAEDKYFIPGVKIEPRYYYGFLKRRERGQITRNNSSDFAALELSYYWLWKKNKSEEDKYWRISMTPKWGFRRAIGKHFVFEAAIGISIYSDAETFPGLAPYLKTSFGYAL